MGTDLNAMNLPWTRTLGQF